MVNNIERVRNMINFDNEFDFYFLQILKRRKDNPGLARDMVVITNYHIESFEQYDSLMPHIINMCNAENARAYLNINKRNYKHLSFHMLKRVVEVISSGMVKSLKGTFDSVCGKHHNDKDKKWIVDIDDDLLHSFDNPDGYFEEEIVSLLRQLQSDTKKEPMIEILPTRNGYHYITRPFNLKVFKDTFPKIDVHKDNPTLLYCPLIW